MHDAVMRGRPTVVLVDTIAAVLELGEQALREAGYTVLATSNPLEAIVLTRTLRVDLVVADRSDVADLFLQPSPPPLLPIVDAQDDAPAQCLRRPFSLDELTEGVAAAVATAPKLRS